MRQRWSSRPFQVSASSLVRTRADWVTGGTNYARIDSRVQWALRNNVHRAECAPRRAVNACAAAPLRGLCLGLLGDELEGDAVVAVPQTGRRRAVVEEVAVVAAATLAVVLGARIDEVHVLLGVEDARDAREEGRPAGARVELHLRSKERQVAARAGKDAGALLVIERAGARHLGALLAQDLV